MPYYLISEPAMELFVTAFVAIRDEPVMFHKGDATLIEGIGEVYQDFTLLVQPQDVPQAATDLPPVELGRDDDPEEHTCDCE